MIACDLTVGETEHRFKGVLVELHHPSKDIIVVEASEPSHHLSMDVTKVL